LAGFNRELIPKGVWISGFKFQIAADSTCPGRDFNTVDDNDDVIYISSDEEDISMALAYPSDASSLVCLLLLHKI
jgi:hypothetical protein